MYDESCLPRIGSNIKILRSTCLFKQQQFAERIGISQTHLSNIEHNNVQVSLKLLLRSANVLGCTLETPRDMYLGFYYAPGVVCEAIKTAIYAQCMLELLGKNPVPRYCDDHNDIVTCFDAGTADALIGFCQGIQAASPVDSYAAPEPSPEPGYTDEVVMASGSFTQGSTIELSCDGPLREPYTCYLQGGLNFAASRAGVLLAIQKAYFKG